MQTLGAMWKKEKKLIITLLGMVGMYIIFHIMTDASFLTWTNLSAIVSHTVVPSFMAWGIVFIFSSGMTDLSIGANMLLACNIGALLATETKLGYVGLILGSILSAVILCCISMLVCSRLRIPSWVSSIGMALVYEGILLGISTIRYNMDLGVNLPSLGHSFREIGTMPIIAFIWIFGAVLAYLIYNHTKIGIGVRAYGSNIMVAESMGFERKRVLLFGSLIGGLFVGCAAAVNMSFSGSVNAVSGLQSFGQLFKPLAAWFLAQAFEKEFNMPIGVLISAFFVMSFFNLLTHMAVPTGTWQEVFLGCIVILFGILSQRGNKEIVK